MYGYFLELTNKLLPPSTLKKSIGLPSSNEKKHPDTFSANHKPLQMLFKTI